MFHRQKAQRRSSSSGPAVYANNPFASTWARHYDLLLSLPPIGLIRRSEERTLKALLERALRPTDAVLEVGPGTGRYTVELARRVAAVTAVEQSPQMAAQLKHRLACEGAENCRVVLGGFMETSLEDGYDVVVCIGVLDYILEPEPFVARLAALTRRELILTAPCTGLLGRLFQLGNRLRHITVLTYTPSQVRCLLGGFIKTEVIETGLPTRLWRGLNLACRAVRT